MRPHPVAVLQRAQGVSSAIPAPSTDHNSQDSPMPVLSAFGSTNPLGVPPSTRLEIVLEQPSCPLQVGAAVECHKLAPDHGADAVKLVIPVHSLSILQAGRRSTPGHQVH